MTPQAAYNANRGDKVLLADQILDCTKPQLLAVWKELNPDGYEPASKSDLQRFFIERYGDYRQHMCTPVPFVVHRKTPSTASNSQQKENFPPIVFNKRPEESESGYVQHTRGSRESKEPLRSNENIGHRAQCCVQHCAQQARGKTAVCQASSCRAIRQVCC